MTKAYADDLRRKIFGAQERKAESLRELAGQFCVSHAWALKVSAQRWRKLNSQEAIHRCDGECPCAAGAAKA